MNRAYSTFQVRSVDDAARTLSGIATTPSTDRMGDIVEPEGAQFDLPLPLLWQHDAAEPIGWVESAEVSRAGIQATMRLASISEPGPLRDRLNSAWQAIKAGLVRGLSIGFAPIEYVELATGGLRFTRWDWLELSAVTIPANADASITSVKHFARLQRRRGSSVRLLGRTPDGAVRLIRSAG